MLSSRWNCSALLVALTFVAGLVACGGDGNKPADASIIDMSPPPPDSLCGAATSYTAEVVDWDETSAAFCGVFSATASVRGDATRTYQTPPNGRITLCLANQGETVVDLAAPTAASQCASHPGTYTKAGILVMEKALVDAGALFSARLITDERIATMYTEGATKPGTYNPNQAHIVLHMTGAPRTVKFSTTNLSAPQQFDGTAWVAVAGDVTTGLNPTGTDVLLPNIDTSGGPVTITITGATPAAVTLTPNMANPGAATLAPDKFTYVTVVTP